MLHRVYTGLFLLFVLLALWSVALAQTHTTISKEETGVVSPIVALTTPCTDTALSAALAAPPGGQIGAAAKVLLLPPVDGAGVPCTWTIASNLTIPSQVTLRIPRGATLYVQSGRTLRVEGPVDADEPAWYGGPGLVVFNHKRWGSDERYGTMFLGYAMSGCTHSVSGSTTSAGFGCEAVSHDGRHIVQGTASVTYPTDGTFWLAVHASTSAAVSGWTREGTTHYLFQEGAARPVDLPDGLTVAQVTVQGGAITATVDLRPRRFIHPETIALSTTVGRGTLWHIERCDAPITVIDGVTLTFQGMLLAPPGCHIFADSGSVDLQHYIGDVDVQWFGAYGDGVTDMTSRVKRWIDSKARRLYLSSGAYLVASGQLVLGHAATLFGVGEGSQLLTASTTGVLLDITTANAVQLYNFVMGHTATATAGCTMRLATTTTSNVGSRFENVRIQSPWVGFCSYSGVFYTWTHSTISNPRHIGIEIQNVINADQGDSTISESIFNIDVTNSTAVTQYNAGGIRFIGNKVLFGAGTGMTGYLYDINGGDTSLLFISNNNFDSIRTDGNGILFRQTSGTNSFLHAMIANNIFTFDPHVGFARGISTDASTSTRLAQVVIHDNHFRPSLNDVPIDLQGGASVSVIGNHIDSVDLQGQFAISVGAGAVGVSIGMNHIRNITVATSVITASPTVTMLFPDVRGLPIAALSLVANGSMTYCIDCTSGSSPCSGTGTGAIAKRLGNAWHCN